MPITDTALSADVDAFAALVCPRPDSDADKIRANLDKVHGLITALNSPLCQRGVRQLTAENH